MNARRFEDLNLVSQEQTFRKLARFGLERLARSLDLGGIEAGHERHRTFVETMRSSPMVVAAEAANAQHYEAPTGFFEHLLGHRLKYSACYYPEGGESLDVAEDASLAQVAARAQLADGQRVLDLGCGWGSNTLYIAERFPQSQVIAVSTSGTQRASILERAARRGLYNVEVITGNIAELELPGRFDRIVSIEMMEHLRNWQMLLERASGWLACDGLMFVHVFTHCRHAYAYDGDDITASKYFTGGIMPSDRLIYAFADHLKVIDHWAYAGTHYGRTARQWLENLHCNRDQVIELFAAEFGAAAADEHFDHWRNFFALVDESFSFRDGQEWLISHYLLRQAGAHR